MSRRYMDPGPHLGEETEPLSMMMEPECPGCPPPTYPPPPQARRGNPWLMYGDMLQASGDHSEDFLNMAPSHLDAECQEMASKARFANMAAKNKFIADCITKKEMDIDEAEEEDSENTGVNEDELIADITPTQTLKPKTAGMKSNVLLWVVIGLGLIYLVNKKVIKL